MSGHFDGSSAQRSVELVEAAGEWFVRIVESSAETRSTSFEREDFALVSEERDPLFSDVDRDAAVLWKIVEGSDAMPLHLMKTGPRREASRRPPP